MKELFAGAVIILVRRPLSSVLTASGIAIGTALVVLISCISTIGETMIESELKSMGIDGLSISSSDGLTEECLMTIREMSDVKEAMPLLVKSSFVFVDDDRYGIVNCGIDSGAEQVISLELLHGRMLSRGDIVSDAMVCVVDEALATEAFGKTDVVGETVDVSFGEMVNAVEIVGVTATGSSLLQTVTAMIPYMVYMPYTTVQTYVGTDRFDQIAVRMNSAEQTHGVQQTIIRELSHMCDDIGRLTTENLATQRDRLDILVRILSVGLSAIGGVSLFVSGFGIFTVMLSSVNERTREIGIKKAIGASERRIMTEFLVTAVLLSAVGALVGLAVGIGLIYLGCLIFAIEPMLPIRSILALFLVTLLMGSLFGIYPARRAAKLKPVDALRYDG